MNIMNGDRPSARIWWTAAAGALGGYIGFQIGSLLLAPFFDFGLASVDSFGRMWLGQALFWMLIGACTAATILAADNYLSLRGRWSRDLARGVPLFAGFAFMGGAVSQLLLSVVPISRAPTWAISGAIIGYSIGMLRKDRIQAKRSALGGAIGGGISGVLVDLFLKISYTDAAFAMASLLGTLITGFLIGLCMQLVQEALKTAWLTGVTTGPYEGKQYLLNVERVTVGASELHDISLYRNSELRVPAGALEHKNGTWYWRGEPAEINGAPQTDAPLHSGDSIKLGATVFRFRTKSGAQGDATANSGPPARFAPPAKSPPGSPIPVGLLPAPPLLAPLNPPSAAPVPVPPQVPIATPVSWSLQGVEGYIPLPAPPARLTVGRAPTNTIVLADEGVSSQHAIIEVQSYALKITDTQSTNGIAVNGARMPAGVPIILQPNDRLTLGRTEFQVRRTA